MDWNRKEQKKEKHQFRSYYCAGCKQRRPCHQPDQSFCCPCAYQIEQQRAKKYSDYQQVYQRKQKDWQESFQQLELLKNYQGCNKCGGKEVDAYLLYDENKLVCQSCRMRKESGSSSPISFLEQEKWYKRHWGIDLTEWLTKFQCLLVNAGCAKKWLKDKEHLKNCDCLEVEARELYLLFSNSLKKSKQKLEKCQCEESKKIRVSSDYYAWCEICEASIAVASKKRVIKNRNDPKFWGLEVKEKVLCSDCLEKRKGEMTPLRRAKFNGYRKLGRL